MTPEPRELELIWDAALRPMELADKYSPEGGGEHPYYTRKDWRDEVMCDHTLAGYWEWISEMIEQELNDE